MAIFALSQIILSHEFKILRKKVASLKMKISKKSRKKVVAAKILDTFDKTSKTS